ncbi:hypothetical protein OKW43_000962 [Paraburkholderia sp. WC7.3g]
MVPPDCSSAAAARSSITAYNGPDVPPITRRSVADRPRNTASGPSSICIARAPRARLMPRSAVADTLVHFGQRRLGCQQAFADRFDRATQRRVRCERRAARAARRGWRRTHGDLRDAPVQRRPCARP